MKLLPATPRELENRGHAHCVPVQCQCGVTLLWDTRNGADVECPACRAVEHIAELAPPAAALPDHAEG